MSQLQDTIANVSVSNIGGIDKASVHLESGVNILVGRNATNRTSFLQALMAAHGSRNVSVKADADEGRVTLDIDGDTYETTVKRVNDGVVVDGNPYLDDPEPADLFAFFVELNEARQAVVLQQNLRDLIMRPVDTEQLTTEIEELVEQRRSVEQELDELEQLKRELPKLEKQRSTYKSQLDEKRAGLEDKRAEIDDLDTEVEDANQERTDIEKKLEELNDVRSDLERVRSNLKAERESLDSTQTQIGGLEEELAEVPDDLPEDPDELATELQTLRERKRQLNSQISSLQNIIQFNDRMISGESDVLESLQTTDRRTADGPITQQLLSDNESGICWTCGSVVEASQIDDTIGDIRAIVQEKQEELSSIRSEIDDLESSQSTLEEIQQRRATVQNRLDRLRNEVEERRATIEQLEQERSEKQELLSTLDEAVDEAQKNDDEDEILELNKEANRLEFEIQQLESDLEDIAEEIERKSSEVERIPDLKTERETLSEEIRELRTRIEHLEETAVESFNHHMDELIELLGYQNIDRIWLELKQREVREGRRTVTKGTFELHIIRTSESGETYEDTVDHLSESEREVTGLVFGLAGYLAHDLYEETPFMLLDSLEAIDSDRISKLITYFEEYAPYIVVSLLPEDAQALPGSHHRISEI